jgi:hypothetical protein
MIFSKPATVKLFVPFFGDYKLSARTVGLKSIIPNDTQLRKLQPQAAPG